MKRRSFLGALGALLGLPAAAKAAEASDGVDLASYRLPPGGVWLEPNIYSQHGVVTSGYSRVTDLDEAWVPSKAYTVEDGRVVYNGASYRIPPAPYVLPRRAERSA